ncbi:MAG TPA: phosphotransferase [Solirubrobacterales bacterium]|nr:phosphotransferase [Solirubrobacterales bacterium]
MASAADSPRARRLLATAEEQLPQLYPEFSLEPIDSGYLHDSVFVDHPEGRAVYKVLNTGLEEFAAPPIVEIVANTKRAGECGVGARLLAEFPEVPAIVLEYVDGPALEVEQVQQPETLERIVDAVRRLHTDAEPFASRFDGFEWFERWRGLCLERGYAEPEGGAVLAAGIERIRAALSADPPADVPCHGDLLPGNILDTGSEIRLIDYDYAGMAEPAWDLGGLASENALSPELVELACRRYWGEEASERDIARVTAYAVVFHVILGQLVWALRGAIPDLLPDEVWGELVAEFEERWEIAATALADPDFEQVLAAAR